ncbi:MAG: DUF1963 domain-containing protein [Bacteroidetes bacterium]|nr:MAG: DUF1963 domain-containing protein [Bacteroidota bacterium]
MMNLFKKLFGGKHSKGVVGSFERDDEMSALVKMYQRKTTLLRPHKSKTTLSFTESKFGGEANMTGFDSYPCCPSCGAPLNFVLQLYKDDLPEHYFPENKNLFQVFRCQNFKCPDAYSEKSDLKTIVYYFNYKGGSNRILAKKPLQATDTEEEATECYFKLFVTDDVPDHADCWAKEINDIEKKYGYEATEKYHPVIGTKSGGYPSWQQYPQYPVCNCGKTKDFFFQLSSEDVEDGVKYPPSDLNWSAHKIMIGDLGNIYFFVCKSCGYESIETNWDCG